MTGEEDATLPAEKGTSPTERKLRNKLGRLLWELDTETDSADSAARNAAFVEHRRTYNMKAVKLLRQLEKRGVTITLSEPVED